MVKNSITPETDKGVTRRDFLRISGSGLFVFLYPGAFSGLLPQPQRRYPSDWNAYLKIGEDGRVSLFCPKIEMGQGIYTSMAQILAEELEVSLDTIDPVLGDTGLCPWDSGTTGSRSTKNYGPPLRRAGAEARMVLIQLASEKWNIPAERLTTKSGVVIDKENGSRQLTYAELVAGRTIHRHISGAPVKPVSSHTVSGNPTRRTDSFLKVTGEAAFAADIRLPGMVYAKVLRPPSHGATLVSADVSGAREVSGTLVIHEADLVAVLHANPETAQKALDRVSAKWDEVPPGVDNKTLFEYLKGEKPEGRVHVEKGVLSRGREMAEHRVESEFYNHYVAHAPMEPYAVLAHVKQNRADVWASTQAPFRVQDTVAEALKMPEENIRVRTPFLGGGFGGKKSGQQIVEAVRLSKISGRPVQLAWTRKEEFFYDAFRPAAVAQLNAGTDREGHLAFWEYDILFAGSRSSEPIYRIPHYRVRTFSGRDVHPFPTGAWRGPGSNTNVFAMESQADMLARKAGMDPLQFRLKNLADERMVNVLRAAADQSGYQFTKGPSGNGYGIACTNYLNTCVATIMQVSVDPSSGEVNVERAICAQDMGEIINPRGARLQIEGGITMGISAVLSEEIAFTGGTIHTENFDTYGITGFRDAPPIECILLDRPEIPPQGCGEPAITTVGGALANAIFDAAGARVYTLPMTPDRILEAMRESARQ